MQKLPTGDLKDLKLLGSGGFGHVYRAWSQSMGMAIALKIINGHGGINLKELQKERDMMHKANYTYVLRLIGIYEKQEGELLSYGLIMEYMHNGSIYTLFEKLKEEVPWALRLQILHQIALGMNYLHHILDPPIIHRDLKPQNVLLNKYLEVQLADFGLSKYVGSTTNSSNTSFCGTVYYMPPEAFTEGYKPTKEFDVYSFGILTWSVIAGQEPYNGMDAGVVTFCIPGGSRPDMKLVDKWAAVKMVPEATELMKKCWNGKAEARPSFSECITQTQSMYDAYSEEIFTAVPEVLALLKKHSAKSSRGEDTGNAGSTTNISDPSINITIFKEILKGAEGMKPEGKSARNMGAELPVDAKEFLRKNFAKIIKARPDIGIILDTLYSEKIISLEEQSKIESSETMNEKVRLTVRAMINKGQESCCRFIELLMEYYAPLVESLSR